MHASGKNPYRKKAHHIKDLNERQSLYRLDPPLKYERYDTDKIELHDHELGEVKPAKAKPSVKKQRLYIDINGSDGNRILTIDDFSERRTAEREIKKQLKSFGAGCTALLSVRHVDDSGLSDDGPDYEYSLNEQGELLRDGAVINPNRNGRKK